ncbi:hypothetical protein LINPERHAP2_LOCUS34353 [Linum perenne]
MGLFDEYLSPFRSSLSHPRLHSSASLQPHTLESDAFPSVSLLQRKHASSSCPLRNLIAGDQNDTVQQAGADVELNEPSDDDEMYEVEDERLGSLKEKESQPSQYHGFNPVPAALTTLLKEGLPSKSAEKPPMNVIRQNLEMMSSMLKNNVDSISPEMRSKLESEINGLLKKVSSVPKPSS